MSDLTRLEYFAAAALTGLLSANGSFGFSPELVAGRALANAVALRDAIDRFYDPDYLDPDPPGEGAEDA